MSDLDLIGCHKHIILTVNFLLIFKKPFFLKKTMSKHQFIKKSKFNFAYSN